MENGPVIGNINNNNLLNEELKLDSNSIKQALDINKLDPSLLKVDSGTQLVKRKVVGGVLTGTGITGLVGAGIAGTLVAVKVWGTGVVTALAGLVGAAAAPWVAIAIAGTAVAALIALTVTGIYLLATKPDDKDLKKILDAITQARNALSSKIKEQNDKKDELEKLEAEAAAPKEQEIVLENEKIVDENVKNNTESLTSLLSKAQKIKKDNETKKEISDLNKKISDLENEIQNLCFEITILELTFAQAVEGKSNNLKKEHEELSTFIEKIRKKSSQTLKTHDRKKGGIDNEDKKEINNNNIMNNNAIKNEDNNLIIDNKKNEDNINEIKNEEKNE